MSRSCPEGFRPLFWSLIITAGFLILCQPAVSQQDRPSLPPLSHFSIIEDKNLFHPDRIPTMPQSTGETSGTAFAERTPENFVLHGVIIPEEGKPIALLQEPTLTKRKVKSFVQDEKVGPYILKAVRRDRVILALGGREFEVTLYEEKPKAPPTPPTAPSPPRPSARPRPRPRPRVVK
jgi:hypothetical protein